MGISSFCNNLPVASLLFLYLVPFANSVYFNFAYFDKYSHDIVYEGTAWPNMGAIELSNVNILGSVGQVTYVKSVPLWDSTTRMLSDFSTHFTFSIDTRVATYYGDGLAFFIAPVGFEIPLNSGGGFLGLFNSTTNNVNIRSKKEIIFVEFDSHVNVEWDPPVQHVGINDRSITSIVWASWNASSHSGDTASVWITYNATSTKLSVYWTYESDPSFLGNKSHVSHVVDLRQVLPQRVKIGFSASIGTSVERHTLRSWEFNSTLDIKEDIRRKKRVNARLIVGLVVSAVVLILGISFASIVLWWRRHPRQISPQLME